MRTMPERAGLLAASAAVALSLLITVGCCSMKTCRMCMTGKCAVPAGKVESKAATPMAGEAVINTPGLKALLSAKVPVTLLDARSGKYDDGRRIPGAVALNATSTDQEIAKVVPDKNALVVAYCAGPKCPASHELAERLHKMGYVNVIEYSEGIPGWTEAGNPVEQPK
jgi:rhodanese-related sulfurtransferase